VKVVRRRIESVGADMTEDFAPTAIPRLMADANDDPAARTALPADTARRAHWHPAVRPPKPVRTATAKANPPLGSAALRLTPHSCT
jgi:hypothetical protein